MSSSSEPDPPPRRERARATSRTRRRPGTARRPRKPATQRRAVRARRQPPPKPDVRAELEELGKDLAWSRGVPPVSAQTPAAVRRLHVLMVGWEFPPHHTGGLGVHSYELVRELTRMGHRVTFLTPFAGPFTEVPGVTFRWPGQRISGSEGAVGAVAFAGPWPYEYPISPDRPVQEAAVDYNGWIAAYPAGRDVDVVHVHDWFGTEGAARLARRIHRPLVMTVHSTEYDRSLGHPWREILDRERLGLDAADRVIAVSRHLKAQLVERYGVPEGKVRVIYNAVRPPAWIERLSTPTPFVLYLGRLAAMKGVDTFLRAGARVLRQKPDLLLVIAGEGPEYARLLVLAAHLGIGEQVMFLGKVSEEERAALLARAAVFVLPSVVEPFGIAALEAMAAGVPTIVSKTSGVAEVAREVFAVDFWDIDEYASRIAELLEYPTLRRTMGRRGQDEALRAGWAERAIETLGVYAELIGGKDRP